MAGQLTHPAATGGGRLRPAGGATPAVRRLLRAGGRWGLTTAGTLTAPARSLPDFLIIGAKRSGSTSLYRALEGTAGVGPLRPRARQLKGVHYFDRNYWRGDSWYRGHFPVARPGRLIAGEASPYYLYHPAAAGRATSCVPRARIIVLLRDPVARAISHHRDEVNNGREQLPLRAALRRELAGELPVDQKRLRTDPSYYCWQHEHLTYLEQGHYADQLRSWWDHFPRAQTLVLRSEDLFADPAAGMRRLADFLGLPQLADRPLGALNSAGAGQPDQAERDWLSGYFAPYNRELAALLGDREPWW